MITLTVSDMACAACAETITATVIALDPAAQVQADPQTKVVKVKTTVSAEAVVAAIANSGYSPQVV
ncbi:copper chaperone [Synechococcales cyanobacterium C]|uniref:Copper chaperone n=1 Tax=Petrachloros mirabilis ULC683 TaxID=2781853 RepID=A0A8K1ZW99_9CYAN|nr:heavy-metal-associated domain-containing protein [Petrachloros mirabilis]NCJ06405.1 copper chaperone [Petrachloros mirabilis ULC683]